MKLPEPFIHEESLVYYTKGQMCKAIFDAIEECAQAVEEGEYWQGDAAKVIRKLKEQVELVAPLSTLPSRVCKSCSKQFRWTTTPKDTCQDCREAITDPAEIRRVFELDDAQRPDPNSGFALLGNM